MSSANETRIVMIGRTGNGKSSLGNSLLHSRSAFTALQSGRAVTKDCAAQRYSYSDGGQQKSLIVVDTPGFFDTDTSTTNDVIEKRIASQIFNMTTPGVHAFLIVLRIGRFSPEERNTVDFIRHIFGVDAVKYCIVVFTSEDQLDEGQTLDEFIDGSPGALRELVRACGNRTFVINNKLNGPALEKKTRRLMEIIENTVRMNNGTYYTNAEYQRIERQREEAKQRAAEEERRKKKATEEAIREEERQKAEKNLEKVRQEERRKAEQRERDLERELESARRAQRRQDDDGNFASLMRMFHPFGMGGAMQPSMGGGMSPSPSPMNFDMGTPSQRMSSASSGIGGAHGGRFTGSYVSSTGSANGRPIYEGARGGQYYMSAGGHRVYRQ